jgi:hypothetical protein
VPHTRDSPQYIEDIPAVVEAHRPYAGRLTCKLELLFTYGIVQVPPTSKFLQIGERGYSHARSNRVRLDVGLHDPDISGGLTPTLSGAPRHNDRQFIHGASAPT